ncbi:MAG: HAD-IA family hydrolase [Anaerolineae bacterium]|nr:HAD-IA family hydrolase [Anaerolineae bacterium]
MLRNIIWDVDGTLFDTYPSMAKAIKAALNDLGQDSPLIWIESLAKVSLGHCTSVLADKYHLEVDDLGRAFESQYSRVTAEENPPFPGVIDVCQYICSIKGKNVIVTHRGRKGTMELLAANKMVDYFAGCLTGDEGYPRKPDPAIFEAAIVRFHLKRAETLTIGDRDIDILAGQAAGILSCSYGAASDGVKADLVISDFAELYQYLVKNIL